MGEYDGNSEWVEITNSRLSKNVLPHGTTLPTAGTSKIEPNGLFLKTDSGIIYENTGTLATPTWTARVTPGSFIGTGAEINALTPYAGQDVFCTTSGNGFFANRQYKRNVANDTWINTLRTSYTSIAFDSGGRTENATGSSATASVTIGSNSNRLLLVAVGFSDGVDTVSTVTLGAQSLTKATGVVDGTGNLRTDIWYLIAPNTGAGTITATFTGSVNLPSIGYLSVYNCDQVSGINTATNTTNTGTTTNSTLSITPKVLGSWVFCAMNPNATASAITDTQVWLSTDGSHYMEGGAYKSSPTIGSANTFTINHINAIFCHVAVEIVVL